MLISLGSISSEVFARPILTFIKTTDLPELGLQLKLMPDAREVPQAPPSVYFFQFTRGQQIWKEERFSPMDLWKQGQFAGQWVGRDDNKLLLANMTRMPPKEAPEERVTRAMYEQQMSLATNETPFSSEADLSRWISAFTDYPHPVGKRLDKPCSGNFAVWVFRLDKLSPNRVAYVFRLRREGSKDSGFIWVCAQFDLNTQILMENACEIIEKEFFPSINSLMLARPGGPREPLTREGVGGADSAAMVAARQQVIDSIRNLKGWWYDITPDYIILSNLKGGAGSLVEQLKTSMKVIRLAYRQCIPEPKEAVIGVIRIPATQEEYREYVGEDNSWTQGLWLPGRKELVICPAVDQGVRGKRQSILRVAFHEGFHQYAFSAFGQANASMWFSEGYAQLFENMSLSNGRLKIEESPQALTLLNAMQIGKGMMDLRRLFSLSREEFYDANNQLRAANYALAWALVYYLKKDASSPYVGLLDKYVVAMRSNGGNAELATQAMLAGVDLKRLQLDFERFWQSHTRQAAARRYDPLDLQH